MKFESKVCFSLWFGVLDLKHHDKQNCKLGIIGDCDCLLWPNCSIYVLLIVFNNSKTQKRGMADKTETLYSEYRFNHVIC